MSNTKFRLFNDSEGYDVLTDGEDFCKVHQLTAIADGADPKKVYSNGAYHVHHRTGCTFDDRPSSLELLKNGVHRYLHMNGVWVQSSFGPQLAVEV